MLPISNQIISTTGAGGGSGDYSFGAEAGGYIADQDGNIYLFRWIAGKFVSDPQECLNQQGNNVTAGISYYSLNPALVAKRGRFRISPNLPKQDSILVARQNIYSGGLTYKPMESATVNAVYADGRAILSPNTRIADLQDSEVRVYWNNEVIAYSLTLAAFREFFVGKKTYTIAELVRWLETSKTK